MPANSIKHIEVITNPGPKYDAEGVGGILNIVTVGSGLEGYTATFSGNVSNMGAGGGLFGTIKSGKLTVSARYNYNYNDRPRSYSGGTRRTVGDITDGSSDLDYSGDSKGHGNFQSGSMEASYEIDTLRLITMSFGLWGGGNNSNGLSNTFATMPGTGDDLYQYVSNNRSKSSWYSIDGGIDYQRMFHVKDRMLTFSYKINTRPESSDSYSTYDYDMEDVAPDWQDFMKRMKISIMMDPRILLNILSRLIIRRLSARYILLKPVRNIFSVIILRKMIVMNKRQQLKLIMSLTMITVRIINTRMTFWLHTLDMD